MSAPILSERERHVLEGLARGLVPKQIAHDLKITAKTVLTHRSALARKLHVRTNISIVRAAAALGLLRLCPPSEEDGSKPELATPVLTMRELQVLDGLAGGRVVKEIARELNLCRQTVERHRTGLAQKLNARGNVSIYYAALARGLIA